jgi:nicotinamide-nucleotide adenylyltransferase
MPPIVEGRRPVIARGMIHGRFQPFHSGHLAYLRAAADRSEELFVGITDPDRRAARPEPADPRRHLPESNPFTYTERLMMIAAAAGEAGIAVRIIPFPITEPALWPDYVPAEVVHFIRLFSPWGDTKAGRLRAAGFRVEVLDASEGKVVSGAQVRDAVRTGGPWRALVPPAVARFIDDLPEGHALAPRPAA